MRPFERDDPPNASAAVRTLGHDWYDGSSKLGIQ
jgi:hypothetical protein